MTWWPTRKPDYGRLAPSYDELRPADDNWWQLFDALVRVGDLRGRRVLDVGCGTGRLAAALAERAGAKVWGLDSSPEMLERARAQVPPGVGLKLGRAEAIPFRDGWFERAVARVSVHVWERPAAFAEVRRVLAPGGRFTIATFDPAHFSGFWLSRIFPQLERIDRARFPDEADLRAELKDFASVGVSRIVQETTTTRDEALRRIRGRYISTLELIPDDELEAGAERAERELPERLAYELRWLVVVAER